MNISNNNNNISCNIWQPTVTPLSDRQIASGKIDSKATFTNTSLVSEQARQIQNINRVSVF